MSAVVYQIADALVAALNGHTFSVAFTAARTYRPWSDLKGLAALKVSVAPKAVDRTAETRARDKIGCQIDVAVQKLLPGNDTDQLAARLAEADALLDLVEDIQDFLARASFAVEGLGSWKVTRIEASPIYDPGHWGELSAFTAVSTFTIVGSKGVV